MKTFYMNIFSGNLRMSQIPPPSCAHHHIISQTEEKYPLMKTKKKLTYFSSQQDIVCMNKRLYLFTDSLKTKQGQLGVKLMSNLFSHKKHRFNSKSLSIT